MTAPRLERPDALVNDSAVLRRIADTVAIMLYEMEVLPDGLFGKALPAEDLEAFLDGVPTTRHVGASL